MVSDTLQAIRDLTASERLGAVATIVAGPDLGAKAVIGDGEGLLAGSLPDEIIGDVLADAAELMARERSMTLGYGDREVFVETMAPPPVLLIFGAGHVSQPLAAIGRILGFRVIVADARATWATRQRFPDVDELIVGWPDVVLERVELDARTFVVITSHDPRFEDPVFPAVRDAPIRYLGAMGSRRTHQARVERLRAAGWSEAQTARIHGPIGLDIGATTPEEMAVSIAGEVIHARYGHGSRMSLRGTTARIHPARPE